MQSEKIKERYADNDRNRSDDPTYKAVHWVISTDQMIDNRKHLAAQITMG